MQATMSAVESYVNSDNLNGVGHVGPTFDGGAAAFNPVIPPQFAAPISSFPAGGGELAVVTPPSAMVGEKRKRGRPRKYSVEGAVVPPPPPGRVRPELGSPATSNGKRRGRPPGSGKKHGAVRFDPQIITVQAGEDVSSKIMSLSQNGSQAVCILSANGAISNVTIRQASSSGGTVTYEGRFEILSLSGSYIMLESGGQRSRTGGLSILLAGPDGRVLGGGVAGLLIAATPVQVVVGSFVVGQKPKSPTPQVDNSAGPAKPIIGSPIMRGTPPSESSGSPINQSNDINNNNGMGMLQWK